MPTEHRDIIVIGASAGGVEALRSLISALPADLPAAIFVVLHLWPGGKSFLPEILRRVSPLKVDHAIDGDAVEHGRIYVAPPDLHLFVNKGAIVVRRGPRENRCRPAVNPLFRSAAAAYGRRCIGVILTGTMDDGAAGLWTLKQAGGLAIVQDPMDAAFGDMPQSALAATEVDHCVPLSQIAPLLRQVCRTPLEEIINPALPEVAKLSDAGAKMKPLEMEIDSVGKRSVFSCPECNGALWELQEGGQLSFRCHVGHAYSANALSDEQSTVLEQSLWSALRALAESAALDERLATRSEEQGLAKAAAVYRQNAFEKKEQETHVRAFLGAIRPSHQPVQSMGT